MLGEHQPGKTCATAQIERRPGLVDDGEPLGVDEVVADRSGAQEPELLRSGQDLDQRVRRRRPPRPRRPARSRPDGGALRPPTWCRHHRSRSAIEDVVMRDTIAGRNLHDDIAGDLAAEAPAVTTGLLEKRAEDPEQPAQGRLLHRALLLLLSNATIAMFEIFARDLRRPRLRMSFAREVSCQFSGS